jgi:hypothetical protein
MVWYGIVLYFLRYIVIALFVLENLSLQPTTGITTVVDLTTFYQGSDTTCSYKFSQMRAMITSHFQVHQLQLNGIFGNQTAVLLLPIVKTKRQTRYCSSNGTFHRNFNSRTKLDGHLTPSNVKYSIIKFDFYYVSRKERYNWLLLIISSQQ